MNSIIMLVIEDIGVEHIDTNVRVEVLQSTRSNLVIGQYYIIGQYYMQCNLTT